MKDWTGNSRSAIVTMGGHTFTEDDREENDFYATNPESLILFLERLQEDNISINKNIWECSCGDGSLSKTLIKRDFNVVSSDLIDRGFGTPGIDFLKQNKQWRGDILTNPPYKYAMEFVQHSMELIETSSKCIMFLKLQFLEGIQRRKLFEQYPPRYIYVFSKRQSCAKNGDFEKYRGGGVSFAWYIWEKGFKGDPIIRWI